MDLRHIVSTQRSFDERHGWLPTANDGPSVLKCLQEDAVGLMGELGEIANVIKRLTLDANRGEDVNELLKQASDPLEEEVTDCFIYIIRIASYLNVDLSESYAQKLARNEERFARFAKP